MLPLATTDLNPVVVAAIGAGGAMLVPFWLGIISAGAVLPLEMALMIPVMVVVMLCPP